MAEDNDYDADDDFDELDELDELDSDIIKSFDDSAANDEAPVIRRSASANARSNVWQRLDSRWENQWLREQLSDWDDWDESADAI